MADESTRWLRCFQPRPAAKLRLVCMPFAGAGATAFRTWSDDLPEQVEVVSVQLPGREERRSEPLVTDCAKLVEAIAGFVASRIASKHEPFCLFGHSLGAKLSYEVVCELRRRGARGPAHLFVSGRCAPQLPPRYVLNALPDEQLVAELRRLNGTPKAILDEPELLAMILPVFRADCVLNEIGDAVLGDTLDCPVTAFGGRRDDLANEAELDAWRAVTKGAFAKQLFPGDHFYLVSGRRVFLDCLSVLLAPYIG